jgi:rRNA metabolism SBDS family protein
MTNTTARIVKGGKRFEILVDEAEAIRFRRGEPGSSFNAAVLTDAVFYNLKSGEHASSDDMEVKFGTNEFEAVCTKIIKEGEVVRTTESLKSDQNKQYKQVVDFLVKNAISPEGRPYPENTIMKALSEAHVNVKNKPVESQITEIMDQLSKILPIKIETKKVKLTIPAQHTGKAYGTIKEFMKEENWMNNGDLEAIIEVPAGLIMDFYDKINDATSGSVLSEEIAQKK